MAKKRKAAKRRETRRPARRRRRSNPDATINTLVILVVIVLVLGGLFLYAQNKKQAALFPGLTQAIAAIATPILRALPAAGIGTSDITGSVRAPQPAAGAKVPAADTETPPGPASAVDAPQPATVAVARTPQDD